jgi:hypothetical protein
MSATIQVDPVRRPLRARPGAGVIQQPARPARARQPSADEPLARAQAARIIAERRLLMAINEAELRYEETAELGREFDRRLERTKSALRAAGYLRP